MTLQQDDALLSADPRYRAVMEARAAQARRTARGVSAWSTDARPALGGAGALRLPELVLGVLCTLEAFSVPLGPLTVPANEFAMLLLLLLALCRRSTRDASTLQVAGLLVGVVAVFLAVVSMAHGIPDADWFRRLARMLALAALVGCAAAGRIDLRSVLLGILTAMAVNVPLFYAGLVPAPYGSFLTGVLGDKNVAGLYYAAMPVLALAFLRSPRWRALVLVVAAVCVFLTGSRTSMAGLACALVWLTVSPRLGPMPRVALLGLLAWLVTYAEENLARIGIFSDRAGTDWLRANIQEATAAKVAETPWHGQGLTSAYVEILGSTWHFHNSYAGLYTEGGVVLVLGLLLAYLVYGLRITSTRLRTPRRVAVESAAVVVFVSAAQLGEVFITIPSMLILATGAAVAITEKDLPVESQVTERARERVLAPAARRWG